jgi:hypothetical protein
LLEGLLGEIVATRIAIDIANVDPGLVSTERGWFDDNCESSLSTDIDFGSRTSARL